MRCQSCAQKVSYARICTESGSWTNLTDIRTWSSYSKLAESAKEGCELCVLFRQYLTDYARSASLCDSRKAVKLWSCGSGLGLSCDDAFDGTITVPVLQDLTGNRDLRPRQDTSKDVFKQPAEWLQACLQSHDNCRNTHASRFVDEDGNSHRRAEPSLLEQLPKRLLDLAFDQVKVINCAEVVDHGSAEIEDLQQYCTLSYRWGAASHKCVLTKPFKFVLEVSEESMPKTFRDAVTVARKLGVRFLWIHALCIIQPVGGDDQDWVEEGARMGIIYENAVFTIAATGASRADEGFLAAVGKNTYLAEPCVIVEEQSSAGNRSPKCVVLPTNNLSFKFCVSQSPLNQRGWVVQERALSKRILHFTEHGLFWECGAMKANAVDAPSGMSGHQDFPYCYNKENTLSVARVRRTSHVCPVEWFHYVRQYSFAGFTNPSDRLDALSSVARAVQPYIGRSEYLAGLWKRDLIRGLAWSCGRPLFRSRNDFKYIAPTWSWASVVGGVSFAINSLRNFNFDIAEVVDATVRPARSNNAFGSVSHGKLTIKGTLESKSFPLARPSTDDIGDDLMWEELPYWDEEPMHRNNDRSVKYNRHGREHYRSFRTCTCLPIAYSYSSISGARSNVYVGALILEPIGICRTSDTGVRESESREYKRIGWAEYRFDNLAFAMERSTLSSFDRMMGRGVREWMNQNPREIWIY